MGEDPKAIMAATTAAEEKKKEEEARKAEAAKRKAALAAANTASGTGGGVNERAISAERADRWAAETLPSALAAEGGRRQGAPLNASGKADTSPGAYLHVPGSKRKFSTRRNKNDAAGVDESDGSYVEIPDSK